MFSLVHDFYRALAQARKATRRGDVAAAERWLACAERHTILAERLRKAAEQQQERRPAWARGR